MKPKSSSQEKQTSILEQLCDKYLREDPYKADVMSILNRILLLSLPSGFDVNSGNSMRTYLENEEFKNLPASESRKYEIGGLLSIVLGDFDRARKLFDLSVKNSPPNESEKLSSDYSKILDSERRNSVRELIIEYFRKSGREHSEKKPAAVSEKNSKIKNYAIVGLVGVITFGSWFYFKTSKEMEKIKQDYSEVAEEYSTLKQEAADKDNVIAEQSSKIEQLEELVSKIESMTTFSVKLGPNETVTDKVAVYLSIVLNDDFKKMDYSARIRLIDDFTRMLYNVKENKEAGLTMESVRELPVGYEFFIPTVEVSLRDGSWVISGSYISTSGELVDFEYSGENY